MAWKNPIMIMIMLAKCTQPSQPDRVPAADRWLSASRSCRSRFLVGVLLTEIE